MANMNLSVTIFDAFNQPVIADLNSYGKDAVTFGRAEDNDLVLSSKLVSR